LRNDISATLLLVEGTSYRVGQVGGFFRLPIGYTQLYAVCTQVGADAAPPRIAAQISIEQDSKLDDQPSYRWMTMVLFGESMGSHFERGVGQYDTLFWSGDLEVSGRNQPLLVVMDEAHKFLPNFGEAQGTSAHRIMGRIAKEGRKHGVGLMVVSQRPSELDTTILSQCGTMVALRTTNEKDRSAVRAAFPDDLGGLVDLLPSLRTGEGLFVGEAMQIPTRVRIRRGVQSLSAGDPDVTVRWRKPNRPSAALYDAAVEKWRKQSKG
jgi:hypothetical protein